MTVGYYKDADKNREAFDDNGYFRTGDLGFLDAADYLHFRGRLNPEPIPDAPKIKGLLCFFNEKVDLEVDGEAQERPKTQWS